MAFSLKPNPPRKFHGPIPAPRTLTLARRVHQQATSGTHKNLQPCRLPNLFSCQISSSSACADCPASAGSGLLPIQSSTPTLTLTPNFKLALGPPVQLLEYQRLSITANAARPITIQATPTFQFIAIPIIRDGSKQKAHPAARNHRRVGNQLEPLLMSPLLADD